MSDASHDITKTFLYQANHWSQTKYNIVKTVYKTSTNYLYLYKLKDTFCLMTLHYIDSPVANSYFPILSLNWDLTQACKNPTNSYVFCFASKVSSTSVKMMHGVVSHPTCHIMSSRKLKIPFPFKSSRTKSKHFRSKNQQEITHQWM